MEFLIIEPLGWTGVIVAIFTGVIIGLERQVAGKPVGMRTSALICLGTYVFVHLGVSLNDTGMDPSRVLGQVVTGIGFLGAGVMIARDGSVQGVTSAATIWTLAGIGALIGVGYHQSAIIISIVVVAILLGIDLLEGSFKILRRGVHKFGNGDR